MNFKNLLLVVLLLTVFSCQKYPKNNNDLKKELENKIISQTAQQLKKEKLLMTIGIGKSSLEGQEFLSISFQYFQPLTINEARNLIVYASQVFLENLTKNEKLQKLTKKPYTMKNIEIILFCYMPDHSAPLPPKLGIIDIRRNTISYMYNKDKFETIYKETYQEALEKLRNKNIKFNSIENL